VNILVIGAAGFIGRHLVQRLFESGHDVTPCGTDPARLRRVFPGLRCIAADYGRDSAEPRIPRLAGVDVVINAAGLIRETGDRSYRRVHTEGPIALFEACLAASVGRVLQISAVGADAGAVTRYHLSKRAADDHLAALDPAGERLDWCVLRPSLVLGPGGWGPLLRN
jgi:nucleoside-diphosphate-sugar epimerase